MNKLTILLFAATLLAAPSFAKQPEAKDADAAKDKPAASAAKEDGETVQTPFGRVAKRDPAPKPAPRKKGPSMVSVREEGDTLHFTRKTPFGAQNWSRKKSALSAAEKQLARDAGLSLTDESVAKK